MEYDELKSLWDKYDNKLNNLERLNKKLIRETLLLKPRRKLNWHKYKSMYGLISMPVILIIALRPNFKVENLDFKFFFGCILTIGVIVYLSLINLRRYLILKRIDLDSDTVLESASKVADYKISYNSNWKHSIATYPILYAGVILIAWKSFNFDTKTIAFLITLFLITYAINIKAPKIGADRIQQLEKDILDLKEYTD